MSGRLPNESDEITNENPDPEADVGLDRDHVNIEGTSEPTVEERGQQDGSPHISDENNSGESEPLSATNETKDKNAESESVESEMLCEDNVKGNIQENQEELVGTEASNVSGKGENDSALFQSQPSAVSPECDPSDSPQNESDMINKAPADQAPECDQALTESSQSSQLNISEEISDSNAIEGQDIVKTDSSCGVIQKQVEMEVSSNKDVSVNSKVVETLSNCDKPILVCSESSSKYVDKNSGESKNVENVKALVPQSYNSEGPSGVIGNKEESSKPDSGAIQDNNISVKPKSKKFPISRKSPPGIDFLHLSDSSEDELLNELDAALLNRSQSSQRPTSVTPTNSKPTTPHDTLSTIANTEQCQNGLKQFPLKDSHLVQNVEQTMESLRKELRAKDEELKSASAYSKTLEEKVKNFDEEKKKLTTEIKKLKEQNSDNLYLPQIKELEKTIAAQEKEIQQTKETLTSHDNLAKRKIATMQNDYKARIDQVTKMYEDCLREKDTMVVNYAVAEQKNIEAKKATEKAEQKFKDCLRDQEVMSNKMKAMKAEKQKALADYEAKQNELLGACKEIERMKEMLTSADVRIRWAQNKLKSELESHKETKIELEKTNQKLKMAREETMQIRKDCQAIVKTYQESEEIKSNSLDKELKLKESELIVQRQEKSDSQEVYNMTVKELEVLRSKHKDALAELKTLRDKVYCLENERKENEDTMTQYQDIIQKQKGENKALQDKIANIGQLEEDFTRAQDMIKTLDKEISELRINNKDLQSDIEGCRTRESELLELTQKLSRTNAKLQSENTNANNQVVSLSGKTSNMEMEIHNLQTRCDELSARLAEDGNKFENECTRLKADLTEKNRLVSELKQKLEDEKDLNKTLKRKHANNVKDITRQLQQARKKLEWYENHGEKDGNSLGSRTSSNGSLNTASDNHPVHQSSVNNNNNPHSNTHHHHQQPLKQEQEYPVITEQVEVDKQVLIERIVRLQKAHARKNEKLEFLQDHIQQLVDEVQKKKKIIQSYILREEQGALAPESMDENKALLAKKGGIMASLYSHHPQDGHMTLDLSLEINQKLQGVLEDTLLKNITLKENIDTLGTEIARLSKENRQIQLQLQSQ